MLLKRSFLLSIGLLLAMFIAACGSSTSTSGTNSSTSPTPTATSSSSIIKTATATVKGNSQTILTNMDGKTLYYFTSDSATTSACSGGCAGAWPPLLFTGSGTPAGDASLPGKLSAQTDTNGNQVQYNGHFLYLYSGDTAAGQTNGEGLFGKWFVATPNLSTQTNGSSNGYSR